MPTKLEPLGPGQPHWTVFELAGHFDISIGLTRMLIDSAQEGQPGRDRVSFFIFPRSEVAPVVYDYAYTMVEGKKPGDMPGVLRETFTQDDRGVARHAAGDDRERVLRADGAGRVRAEPGRGGRRARLRPDRRAGARHDRDPEGDRDGRRRSSTSCWPGGRWRAARATCPTTWPGCAPRRAGRRTTTRGCR